MTEIAKHFEMLGHKGKDKVTGFKGVITSLSFDLYGCVTCILSPPLDKDKKIVDGRWFDVTRIEITSKKPVMDLPDFVAGYVAQGRKGAAEKPIQ